MGGTFATFWAELVDRIQAGVQVAGPRTVLVLLVFTFFFLIAQLFKLYSQRGVDVNLYKKPTPQAVLEYYRTRRKIFYGRFFWLLFLVLAWTLAIAASGIGVRTVLDGLGFLGLALAWALSDLIQQYFAGFLILTQKHINIGEQVDIKGVSGVIKSIEARYTIVRDFMERDVMVPNTDILKNAVVISEIEGFNRDFIRVRVAIKTDLRQAIAIGEEAIRKTPGVELSVPPKGYVRYFGDSTQLAFYYTGPAARREHFILRSEIMINLDRAYKNNQIEISYPYGIQYMENETD
ncbi:MAG: mechanosensitive ion channel domain-containing protein [Parcubacteria group bacterium]